MSDLQNRARSTVGQDQPRLKKDLVLNLVRPYFLLGLAKSTTSFTNLNSRYLAVYLKKKKEGTFLYLIDFELFLGLFSLFFGIIVEI